MDPYFVLVKPAKKIRLSGAAMAEHVVKMKLEAVFSGLYVSIATIKTIVSDIRIEGTISGYISKYYCCTMVLFRFKMRCNNASTKTRSFCAAQIHWNNRSIAGINLQQGRILIFTGLIGFRVELKLKNFLLSDTCRRWR